MALCTVKRVAELGPSMVLAPERYDPRREAARPSDCVRLSDLATCIRETVGPQTADQGDYLILDTSNAREGIVVYDRGRMTASQIGSAKKIVRPGDVIISRLRPYLRQVAFVDRNIRFWNRETTILCSTEFFILRSIDGLSIAFLVPFLLSEKVQEVLAASQEGGHHPRVNENTVLTLQVPTSLVKQREQISERVEGSVALFRRCEKGLLDVIVSVDTAAASA
jgi:hypothetical protein